MGLQFFETIMGRTFFEGQFPALIRAIEKVGVQIEKTATQQAAMLERLPPPGIQEENERLREALRIANERNERLEIAKAEQIVNLHREIATLRRRCELHREYEDAVNSAVVHDTSSDAMFHPRYAEGLLGYRCVLKDGTETFITLVPSTSTDDGEPVVFSYFGTTGDPEVDSAMCHCTMDPRKDDDE